MRKSGIKAGSTLSKVQAHYKRRTRRARIRRSATTKRGAKHCGVYQQPAGLIYLLFILWVLFALPQYTWCQSPSFSWLEHAFTPEEIEVLLEEWAYFHDYPVDLNRATKAELLQLPAMTLEVADLILAFRSQNAPLVDQQQLNQITAIPEPLLLFLLPLFSISEPAPAGASRPNQPPFVWDILLRTKTESERSTRPTSLPFYGRAHFSRGKQITFALVADHDAGEPFVWSPKLQKAGFDHLAGYLEVTRKGVIQRLVLGNFRVSLGSGLLLDSRLFSTDPSRAFSNTFTTARLSPYRSSTEHSYFRGGGIWLGNANHWDALLFASSRPLDATLHPPVSPGQDSTVRSIRTSGLHRTGSERAAENTLIERMAGISLSYSIAHVLFRWNGICSTFSRMFYPAITHENRHKFRGQDYCGHSSTLRASGMRYALLSELAWYRDRTALYTNLNVQLWRRGSANIAFRRYEAGFVSLYGRGSGQQSRPQNEQGITLGIGFDIKKGWKLRGYTDQYHFKWITSNTIMPASGYETGILWEGRLENGLLFNLLLKHTSSEYSTASPVSAQQFVVHPARRSRFQWNTTLRFDALENMRFYLMARAQQAKWRGKEENAWLIGQRLEVRLHESFRIRFQHALFETASNEVRLSLWEPDVRYAFSLLPVTRPGSRLTLHIWRRFPGIMAEIRYARMVLDSQPFSFEGTKPLTHSIVNEIVIQIQITKQ